MVYIEAVHLYKTHTKPNRKGLIAYDDYSIAMFNK